MIYIYIYMCILTFWLATFALTCFLTCNWHPHLNTMFHFCPENIQTVLTIILTSWNIHFPTIRWGSYPGYAQQRSEAGTSFFVSALLWLRLVQASPPWNWRNAWASARKAWCSGDQHGPCLTKRSLGSWRKTLESNFGRNSSRNIGALRRKWAIPALPNIAHVKTSGIFSSLPTLPPAHEFRTCNPNLPSAWSRRSHPSGTFSIGQPGTNIQRIGFTQNC